MRHVVAEALAISKASTLRWNALSREALHIVLAARGVARFQLSSYGIGLLCKIVN